MIKNPERYTVTAALPYANGPVHIGHLAGVYVPADIYVRYLRLRKRDVLYICGSDEHGVPITLKARNEGKTPQEIVDRYHNINKKAFSDFGISFDIYSRTTTKTHYETASEFFKTLYDKGEFIEKTNKQYYDPEAKQFLADRYITGTCPHCGYENAYGDQCENCGTSLSALELINPKSAITGSKPELKETKHWYLPLDKYQPFLEKWILEDHKEWKDTVKGQCSSWFKAGLRPRAVSRDLSWGVPLPIENTDGKVLYVWFDAPIGYISATKELTDDWEKYWKDPKTKLVHFIGKDNIVFHCIIFPAMLKQEGSYILPDNVPSNQFMNLEHNKISTSKNWAVWLHEYLLDFPDQQDVLRYTLTINAPENKDNNFTWKDFQTHNNKELVADLGNFINRVIVLTNKYYKGIVPSIGELTDYDIETMQKLRDLKDKIETGIENYHFREALVNTVNISRLGNKYLAKTEPWLVVKTDQERVKTIMNISLQLVANISTLIEPFLPHSAVKIRELLNIEQIDWEKTGTIELIKPEHKINKAKLLFDKIENEQIEKQVKKLEDVKLANEKLKPKITPLKETITFEDYQKLDIRIGTVIEAEKVSKTKKLSKLKIDTGIDVRTLVAGISQFYTAEQIIGKQVTILANLKPKKIRGIKSQGMILMVENPDGKLVLLQPTNEVENGSTVG